MKIGYGRWMAILSIWNVNMEKFGRLGCKACSQFHVGNSISTNQERMYLLWIWKTDSLGIAKGQISKRIDSITSWRIKIWMNWRNSKWDKCNKIIPIQNNQKSIRSIMTILYQMWIQSIHDLTSLMGLVKMMAMLIWILNFRGESWPSSSHQVQRPKYILDTWSHKYLNLDLLMITAFTR